MSKTTKSLLIQAALGAVVITLVMLPFQVATPYALYSPLLILPVMLFFTLQASPKALLAMFLSFCCGVGWAALFLLVAGALPGVPIALLMAIGVTLIIFVILAGHPILLGKTPFGLVPAVLLGMIESLLVVNLMPLLSDGVPRLNLLALIAIFGYGCLMTLVLVVVQSAVLKAALGKGRQEAPTAVATNAASVEETTVEPVS